MDKNLLNISTIETFFNELLDEKVSSNTFFTTVPTNIDTTWSDLVVIDCANSIQDLNAYGVGTVLVWLYAKPFSNGRKNVAVMSKLEKALNEALENNKNASYAVSKKGTFADFDSDAKMHCNIVEIQLLIV
jgi:hypothetical protein|nr:MAG TPA: hypothetical protein [Caudoviricetes sp.]DAP81658.1 MAG TPA: hypothetical protein [Caudoviricetes sp.]DAV63927.1 MAG TPA: hypothetical protein [Caudoviricetes sp.]DAY68895.1 MAG TPA: hypothetical protein [Caudoviricetes sp.]